MGKATYLGIVTNQLIVVMTTLEKIHLTSSAGGIKHLKTEIVPEMNNINELKSRYNQIYPAFGSYTGNSINKRCFSISLQISVSLQSV